MNANELKLGNYINWIGRKEDARIMNGSDFDLIYVDLEDNEIENKSFKPIPLTEKWLLDFGFKKEDDCDWYNKSVGKRKELSYNTKTKCFVIGFKSDYTENFATIKSVHQLQNLYFALTNNELKRVDGF